MTFRVSSSSPFTDRRVVVALATLCCLLWGSAVPVLKIGYELLGIAPSDPPTMLLFAGIRFTLSGLILLFCAALARRSVLLPPRGFAQVGLLGLISTAGQYLFFYIGVAHSTGVRVSITTSTSTFFSVLLAHVIYHDDRLSRRRVLGCLLGFAGVVAVNLAPGGIDIGFTFLGEGFIIIAAALFSIAGIYGKGVSRTLDVTVMTGWQLLLGGVMLSLAGLATGGRLPSFGLEGGLLLAYLAALSAAAFGLWSLLLKHNPVGDVAIFNCLIPVFGVGLAGLLLGENILEWKNLVALVLVSLGIFMVTARRA